MMDHLSHGVEALVELEHKTIVDKHGAGYHSAHEGYAVLLEEVEEAEEALLLARNALGRAWEMLRVDSAEQMMQHIQRVEHWAQMTAAEAVQVAAVCRRMRGGCGE